MRTLTKTDEVRQFVSGARRDGKSVGFVPTMGALHEGHLSLIRQAKQRTEIVIVSIFVNPTQFGPTEDLDAYPRDLAGDEAKCRAEGVDVVFAPSANEMYPRTNLTWVDVKRLTENLCGASRPGHFRGVTTVCTKLFNIVGPDLAFFGQKDAQQVQVIKRMVADLNMPLEIVTCETVREADGLAMSSRNKYLSAEDRKFAPLIHKSLIAASDAVAKGERRCDNVRQAVRTVLGTSDRVQPEYISIVDLEYLDEVERIESPVLIAIAARLGGARLIDNIIVDVNTGKA